MDSKILQQLLGDMPVETFLAAHYQRQPLARANGAPWVTSIDGWAKAERLLAIPQSDVLLAREGQPGPARPQSVEHARQLHAAGHTVAFRHVERHDAQLAELGRALAFELLGALDIHLYLTPRGQTGFGWHFDAEEVFIFQLGGAKRYLMRENTQCPQPLLESMRTQLDPTAERTPILECELRPGDWLYIPAGYWHVANAVEGEDSASLAIGLLPPTLLDALDLLRAQLAEDPRWRRRLPPAGRASPHSESQKLGAYQSALESLAAEVSERLRQPAFAFGLLSSAVRGAARSASGKGTPDRSGL